MTMSRDGLPILIAGGGICGLATAIALSKAGRKVHIIEREPSLSSEGAGIQLGPNATRILRDLGIEPDFAKHIVAPKYIEIRNGLTGSMLTRLPIQSYSKRRFGAPYWVVHRAALHQALFAQVGKLPGIDISMGCEVTGVEDRGDRICVHTKGTDIEDGIALIGADGIWSSIRAQIFPQAKPRFSGKTAWRTVLYASDVPSLFRETNVGLWLAPDAHLVHYPIEGGSKINVVAVVSENWRSDDWASNANGAALMGHFSHWWAPIRMLLNAQDEWRRWSLYELPTMKRWREGGIVLAGDAAHAMLPFFAQGGVMALEDAAELARAVKRSGQNYHAAWQLFEQERRGRIAHVQYASRKNGRTYHMSGTQAWGRDMALRMTPTSMLLGRYDWLYGFGAD